MNPDAFKPIALTLIFGGVFVLLPIVSMMISHQQKMAEIFQGKKENVGDQEALRNQIHELTMAVDDLRAEVKSLKALPQSDRDLVERVR